MHNQLRAGVDWSEASVLREGPLDTLQLHVDPQTTRGKNKHHTASEIN